MAILPSPDRREFSPVHLLRRPGIEANEKARKERLAFNAGTMEDWEIEAETAATEERRDTARSTVHHMKEQQQRRGHETAQAAASAWKWVAITLAVMLVLLGIANYRHTGRAMDPAETEARTP